SRYGPSGGPPSGTGGGVRPGLADGGRPGARTVVLGGRLLLRAQRTSGGSDQSDRAQRPSGDTPGIVGPSSGRRGRTDPPTARKVNVVAASVRRCPARERFAPPS